MKIVALQGGPHEGYEAFKKSLEQAIAKIVEEEQPYLIALSELMHIPYFTSVQDDSFFAMAETIDGDLVRFVNMLAYRYNVHIVGTLFEKEEGIQTTYYNSAFLSSPKRGLVGTYRKVHLPRVDVPSMKTDEKYYFEQFGGGGKEFNVLELDNGVKIGCLICYDRSFPEAWKSYGVQDVQIMVVSVATYGFRKDMFVRELQVRAMENNVFVLAANKAGKEVYPKGTQERHNFGLSSIIDPFGTILNQANDHPWSYVCSSINLEDIEKSKGVIDWNNERKPNVYEKYLASKFVQT